MADNTRIPEPLLVFAWRHGLFDRDGLRTRDGVRVEVIDPGRPDASGPQFRDAEVRIGEKTCVGSVAIHEKASDWAFRKRNYEHAFDGVILHAADDDDRIIRKVDDSVLPAVQLELPEYLERGYRALQAGASRSACGSHLVRYFSQIEIRGAFTRLMIDRLERKYNDILHIYESVGRSWHETFHILFFRSMGLGKNKDIYMSLARSVPYAKLCRERGELENIEAMLFGTAGLLDPSLYDDYKAGLGRRFEVLRHRHQLRVMTYCEWSDKGVRPYNFVPRRIAQLASLINGNEFTFDRILACESVEEAAMLFRIELSDYWQRSFSFETRAERKQKTLGEDTIDIQIINLVAPILFAYGRQEGKEELEERAIDFLYAVRAEKNRYTEGWRQRGVKIEHALASQALIQLSTEFCARQRCTECFIGKRMLKNNP